MTTIPTTIHLEIRVETIHGRYTTTNEHYPVDSRIGRLFYGQGRAERVVIHEASGDTRTYTYLGDDREGPHAATGDYVSPKGDTIPDARGENGHTR